MSVLGSFTPSPASADTSSGVTVASKDYDLDITTAPFPDLKVTVSQTRNLVSQGIVVSWTGGKESTKPISGSIGGENFLQIAQCWGEDPAHPGHPDRTTCQYGASRSEGTTRNSSGENADVASQDAEYTVPRTGVFTPAYTSIPFKGVDGTLITDIVKNASGATTRTPEIDVNTNQFFTQLTTNETKWAGSGPAGTGSVPFEIQTAMQSPGLGCGAPNTLVTPVAGQSCWLVVIPRGTGDSGSSTITQSGLLWDSWQHHVAIKLDFEPIGIRCAIGAAERQLSGSELVSGAISSWQPKLCTGPTGSAFVLSTGNEAEAVTGASRTEPSPLAFTSRPLETDEQDPVQYAPVAIAGLAVSFAIDRKVSPVGVVPDEYGASNGLPFGSLNLTPRLIAKLLTQSYFEALPPGDRSHVGFVSFDSPGKNARTLVQDPDFLDVNDEEWAYQLMVSPSLGDLLLPSGRSDLAVQLWRYVLSDDDARAFLDGQADPWGMVVNPWYSTNASVNPTGTGLAVPRESLPKADPIEKPDTTVTDPANGTGAVNLVTWRPYTADFESGAYQTLRGDGLLLGTWDKFSTPPKYGKTARELIGSRGVLALTTTPAANRYQTITASLRNPAGKFVAPNEISLLAAAAAMTPAGTQSRVLEFDPAGPTAAAAPTAYALTMPVYAAINPLQTDSTQRAVYANLIRFAVQNGQTPGTDVGQLPPGYAPLPPSWVAQALAAAAAIESGISPRAQTIPAPSTSELTPPSAPASRVQSYAKPTLPEPGLAPTATGTPADPLATGISAAPLLGRPTPTDPDVGPLSAAVPAGLLSGLLAAGMVPLYSRARRKA
ncbi:hypothetical protein E3O62_04890 [Cryobacterium sp. TMT2-15-1]|uniref:hypothetical protein n=1 Tax=Cryobacterium sp. TMT2-15-1 TaxID=1259246 RepID=UPI001068FA39|nr:hypothetical protein [Cryobacterium sp. TMT2-15-1]TFC61809.1 hypothetical protein E3O62_04890 [Cryobacterium sp. TMT2-15-1]